MIIHILVFKPGRVANFVGSRQQGANSRVVHIGLVASPLSSGSRSIHVYGLVQFPKYFLLAGANSVSEFSIVFLILNPQSHFSSTQIEKGWEFRTGTRATYYLLCLKVSVKFAHRLERQEVSESTCAGKGDLG